MAWLDRCIGTPRYKVLESSSARGIVREPRRRLEGGEPPLAAAADTVKEERGTGKIVLPQGDIPRSPCWLARHRPGRGKPLPGRLPCSAISPRVPVEMSGLRIEPVRQRQGPPAPLLVEHDLT